MARDTPAWRIHVEARRLGWLMGPLYLVFVMTRLDPESDHGETRNLLLRHSDVVHAVVASIVLASLARLIIVLGVVDADATTRQWTIACIVWTGFFAILPHMFRGLG